MKKLSGVLMISFMCTTVWSQALISVKRKDLDSFLNHHNKVRKEVGCGPLVFDTELSNYAAKWAIYLANSNQCRIRHRGEGEQEGRSYGENIFWTSDPTLTQPLEASQSWYSEKAFYTYTTVTATNFAKTGHYTQMVWRNTTKVGIGMAACPNRRGVIVVANYDPPGNYLGQTPY